MNTYVYECPDYEHSGDLDRDIIYLKSLDPEVNIIDSWEEEDREAEADYEDEYGEIDEPIYRGFIKFSTNHAELFNEII